MFRTRFFRAIRPRLRRPPRLSRILRVEPLEARTVPSFLPPADYATDASPQAVVVGDFNADGVPDLVTPNFQGGTVSVLLGNGDGSFQGARNSVVNKAFSAAAGDFNGDGLQDLAVGTLGEYPLFEESS